MVVRWYHQVVVQAGGGRSGGGQSWISDRSGSGQVVPLSGSQT